MGGKKLETIRVSQKWKFHLPMISVFLFYAITISIFPLKMWGKAGRFAPRWIGSVRHHNWETFPKRDLRSESLATARNSVRKTTERKPLYYLKIAYDCPWHCPESIWPSNFWLLAWKCEKFLDVCVRIIWDQLIGLSFSTCSRSKWIRSIHIGDFYCVLLSYFMFVISSELSSRNTINWVHLCKNGVNLTGRS